MNDEINKGFFEGSYSLTQSGYNEQSTVSNFDNSGSYLGCHFFRRLLYRLVYTHAAGFIDNLFCFKNAKGTLIS